MFFILETILLSLNILINYLQKYTCFVISLIYQLHFQRLQSEWNGLYLFFELNWVQEVFVFVF